MAYVGFDKTRLDEVMKGDVGGPGSPLTPNTTGDEFIDEINKKTKASSQTKTGIFTKQVGISFNRAWASGIEARNNRNVNTATDLNSAQTAVQARSQRKQQTIVRSYVRDTEANDVDGFGNNVIKFGGEIVGSGFGSANTVPGFLELTTDVVPMATGMYKVGKGAWKGAKGLWKSRSGVKATADGAKSMATQAGEKFSKKLLAYNEGGGALVKQGDNWLYRTEEYADNLGTTYKYSTPHKYSDSSIPTGTQLTYVDDAGKSAQATIDEWGRMVDQETGEVIKRIEGPMKNVETGQTYNALVTTDNIDEVAILDEFGNGYVVNTSGHIKSANNLPLSKSDSINLTKQIERTESYLPPAIRKPHIQTGGDAIYSVKSELPNVLKELGSSVLTSTVIHSQMTSESRSMGDLHENPWIATWAMDLGFRAGLHALFGGLKRGKKNYDLNKIMANGEEGGTYFHDGNLLENKAQVINPKKKRDTIKKLMGEEQGMKLARELREDFAKGNMSEKEFLERLSAIKSNTHSMHDNRLAHALKGIKQYRGLFDEARRLNMTSATQSFKPKFDSNHLTPNAKRYFDIHGVSKTVEDAMMKDLYGHPVAFATMPNDLNHKFGEGFNKLTREDINSIHTMLEKAEIEGQPLLNMKVDTIDDIMKEGQEALGEKAKLETTVKQLEHKKKAQAEAKKARSKKLKEQRAKENNKKKFGKVEKYKPKKNKTSTDRKNLSEAKKKKLARLNGDSATAEKARQDTERANGTLGNVINGIC